MFDKKKSPYDVPHTGQPSQNEKERRKEQRGNEEFQATNFQIPVWKIPKSST